VVKDLQVIRVWTANGEMHYILHGYERNESRPLIEYFDLAKIKRSVRKEASKPFLLGDE
jgi:hypothetical protein